MDLNNIEDVLNVSAILQSHALPDGANSPSLIASLIEWADNRTDLGTGEPEPIASNDGPKVPKGKGGKATESPDSLDEKFAATPDPSDEPDF